MSESDERAAKRRREHHQTQLIPRVGAPVDAMRAPTEVWSVDTSPAPEPVPATVRQPPALDTDPVRADQTSVSAPGLQTVATPLHATMLGHHDIEPAPVTLPFRQIPGPHQTLPVPPAAALEDTLDDAPDVPAALPFQRSASSAPPALPFQRSPSSLPPATSAPHTTPAPGALPFERSASSPPPAPPIVPDALPFQRSASSLPPPAVTPPSLPPRMAKNATMLAPTGFALPEPLPFHAASPPTPVVEPEVELAPDSVTADVERPALLGDNRNLHDTLTEPGMSAPREVLPFAAGASPPPRFDAAAVPLPQATPFDDVAAPKNLGGAFLAALARTGFRPRPRRDDDRLWND